MRLSGSFAEKKKNFKNRYTKPKLLRFEVESGDCGQITIELNSATVELE